MHFFLHVAPEDRDSVHQAVAMRLNAAGSSLSAHCPGSMIHPLDQRERPTVQRDDAGKPVTMIGTVADITTQAGGGDGPQKRGEIQNAVENIRRKILMKSRAAAGFR